MPDAGMIKTVSMWGGGGLSGSAILMWIFMKFKADGKALETTDKRVTALDEKATNSINILAQENAKSHSDLYRTTNDIAVSIGRIEGILEVIRKNGNGKTT